jgi:light-regulated signal transduction histidine kinase (bacteriophytochrome)
MPERLREAHLRAFQRFLDTREARIIGRPVELTALRKDGSEFPVELSLASWESEDGIHFTGIVRDITERRAADESLSEKMEELARSNAELGLFTYVASHDLREPLRTVGSNVQLVARRLGAELDDEVRRSIDFALSGVRRMQGLIDDLLIYSRVGTEGKSFAMIEAGTALSEAEANLRVAIEESGAEIERGRLPRVRGDHSQIVQLFQNLLSNAIKFRRDGETPRVRISAEREGPDWMFTVEDNGIGIEPAYVDHVFTIFQRLHAEERYPGTGIGLAVCRKILERHGGRIWVEPRSGEGATFRFTLPAAAPR